MQNSNRMLGVNVRMSDDLFENLQEAAQEEHRTVRGLIRHILRSDLAKQGYLIYNNVNAPLLEPQR